MFGAEALILQDGFQTWWGIFCDEMQRNKFAYSCSFLTSDVKVTVFWDVGPCSLVEVYRRFRGAYCLCRPGIITVSPNLITKFDNPVKWGLPCYIEKLTSHRPEGIVPVPNQEQYHEDMKIYEPWEYSSMHCEYSTSRWTLFIPGERAPGVHCVGAGWAPEPVWTGWRKRFMSLPGIEPLPSMSPITLLTELTRFYSSKNHH
jgi:hypothetical protein